MKNAAEITLRPISAADTTVIQRWFDRDPKGAKWVSSYRDIKGWLQLLTANRRGWVAQADNTDIGFIDLEQNGEIGYFSYYVALDYRRRGYGVELLRSMEPLFRSMGVKVMEGYFEPDNMASRRALELAGYELAGRVDKDGMIKATKSLA